MGMPVPDDLIDFFSRAQRAKGISVTWTPSSVSISCGGKSVSVDRPCTMPQLEAAAAGVKK